MVNFFDFADKSDDSRDLIMNRLNKLERKGYRGLLPRGNKINKWYRYVGNDPILCMYPFYGLAFKPLYLKK